MNLACPVSLAIDLALCTLLLIRQTNLVLKLVPVSQEASVESISAATLDVTKLLVPLHLPVQVAFLRNQLGHALALQFQSGI
jgi:hypothetical protein